MLIFSGSLRPISAWPRENWESGASDHQKKTKQEKPRGHWTPPFSPSPRGANLLRSLKISWHTVHATEIEIDQSELSTRGKLSFPTSEGERTRGTRLSPVQSSIVFVYVRLPAMSAIPSTPVILVRFTFIYMNAGKQVLISMQL